MNTKDFICRFCAAYKPLSKLIDLENNEAKCKEIVFQLTRFNVQVDLHHNIMPNFVCVSCCHSLHDAYIFITTVEQNQSALSEFVYMQLIKEKLSMSISDNDSLLFDQNYDDIENTDDEVPVNLKMEYIGFNPETSSAYLSNTNSSTESEKEQSSVGIMAVETHGITQIESAPNNFIGMQHKQEKSVSEEDTQHLRPSAQNFDLEDDEVPINQEFNENIKIESDNNPDSPPLFLLNTDNSTKGKENNKNGNRCISPTWDDYTWLCSYCDTQFPNINELRIHSMQYHNACNPYRCTDCRRRNYHLDSFITHVKRHRKYLKLSCYKCPIILTSIAKANRHKHTHQRSNYICFGCNTNFANQDELYKHASTYYKETQTRKPSMALETDGLTCKICGKTSSKKCNLNTHILLMHGDRKKIYTCEICGKSFQMRATLQGHMIMHTDERPFQCDLCESTFKTKKRLSLHAIVHDERKPYQCNDCQKCFRRKDSLLKHSIIHTDRLPHVCSFCNKGFRFRHRLTQHIRQHTGEKPYSCDTCKWSFTNWPNYNKHMKRRHGTNMSKKKNNTDRPVDPDTKEVVKPDDMKMEHRKIMNIIMKPKTVGRPKKTKKDAKVEQTQSNKN